MREMNYIWLNMYVKSYTGYEISKNDIIRIAKEMLFYTEELGINTENEINIRKCIKNLED